MNCGQLLSYAPRERIAFGQTPVRCALQGALGHSSPRSCHSCGGSTQLAVAPLASTLVSLSALADAQP